MRSVAYKNDNFAYLRYLIMPPDPFLLHFLFLEHNSAAVLIILGRIIEQVTLEGHIQE